MKGGVQQTAPVDKYGLDAIDKMLNTSYTLRELLPMLRFLEKAKETAEVWSLLL